MFKNEDKCYSQRHVSWVWLKVRTKRAANILEKKILKRSYLPVRNVKQNIHSPQRHKGTISSGTQVCQVLLPLSSTPLVCSPHCHYPCSGKLDKVCFSPDEELWMCKREPFWQKSVYRGQLLRFLLHRHLATGGSRNRIRHKSEFKKKPLWFERTTAKNPQMPMREHKVCKSEWTPTSSKAFWGCWPKGKENLVLPAQDHEEPLLPNPGNIPTQHRLFHSLESPWRAQVGREELQLVWYQQQRCTRHRPRNVSQGPCPQLVWSLGQPG